MLFLIDTIYLRHRVSAKEKLGFTELFELASQTLEINMRKGGAGSLVVCADHWLPSRLLCDHHQSV